MKESATTIAESADETGLSATARHQPQRRFVIYLYGGRGIKFLYESFEQFLADVGPRPAGRLLERCDNAGHYEPGNCRWTTPIEQQNNKRNNRRVTAFGRTRTLARWARECGIKYTIAWKRLERGWPAERALTK